MDPSLFIAFEPTRFGVQLKRLKLVGRLDFNCELISSNYQRIHLVAQYWNKYEWENNKMDDTSRWHSFLDLEFGTISHNLISNSPSLIRC